MYILYNIIVIASRKYLVLRSAAMLWLKTTKVTMYCFHKKSKKRRVCKTRLIIELQQNSPPLLNLRKRLQSKL